MLISNVVVDWLNNALHALLLLLDEVVYWAASQCYQLFIKLANTRLFEESFFANFSNRIYAILGIFMLFYLAYALLTAIVDPEKFVKGDKGVSKIATNLVVSLVILGFLPTIFSYAYRMQNYILSSNLIGSLILGTSPVDVEESQEVMVKYGDVLSFTVLNTFLNPDNVNFTYSNNYSWYNFKDDVLSRSDYTSLPGMNKAVATGVPVNGEQTIIFYMPIISTAVGVFLIYVMISFTIDLGIRVIKFAFCQLLAPIPVIMRVVPGKKGTFDKWLKQTLSVYFEVFVRVGIMYMAVYFINAIATNADLAQFFGEGSGVQGKLAFVVVIMGILAFAKQAPKMLSDMLGINTGGLKLGIQDKLKAAGPVGSLVNRVTGGVTGALGGAYSSLWNGAGLSGLGLGLLNGWKKKGLQFKNQRQEIYSKVTGDTLGTAGWFGGNSNYDRLKKSASDHLKNVSTQYRNDNMADFERPIINEKQREFQQQQQEANRQYQEEKRAFDEFTKKMLDGLQNTFDLGLEKFEENRDKQLEALQKKYIDEEALFQQDVEKRRKKLQQEFNQAKIYNNIPEQIRLQDELKKLSQEKYTNTELTNKINALKNSTYDNTEEAIKIKQQISEAKGRKYENSNLEKIIHSEFDEDAVIDDIRKNYKNYSGSSRAKKKYKANVDTMKRLGEEKANKAQKDAFEKVLKDLGYKKEDKK